MAHENITLNLIPTGDVPSIHVAQYDVDRQFTVTLKEGTDDFTPTGYDIELQVRKVDNNIVTAIPTSTSGNVITFNTTEQMTACSGTNLAELQLTEDDQTFATLHFYLVVQRDVLAGGLTSQSAIHDLAEQIAVIVPEVIGDEYYTAEEVDEKIAEIPTFDPTNYYTKSQLYTQSETNGLLSQKASISSLNTVAFTGSYNDLSDTPVIPDVSDYYTKSETYSQNEVNILLSSKADTSSLSTVATTGDYADLINKPSIPAAQVQSDWSQSDNTKVDYIKNKPTIPAAQVQSDWSQSDNTKVDYIKNKPTIPAAQVNSDWNAVSGVAQILNKPSLSTVATSGSYNDLTNKPTIPTDAEQLPIQSGSATNTKSYIDSGVSNIADTYDTQKSGGYRKDDCVIYENVLYKARYDIAEPVGAFNPNHWETTTTLSYIDSGLSGKANTSNYPNFTKILSVATDGTTVRFIVNHNSDSAFSIFVMFLGGTLLYLGKASADGYASYNAICGSINAHSEDSTHVYLNVGNYKRATFIIASNDSTGLGNISITTS